MPPDLSIAMSAANPNSLSPTRWCNLICISFQINCKISIITNWKEFMHVFAVFVGLLLMHAVILHDFFLFYFFAWTWVDVDGSPWLQQKKVRLFLLHGRAFFLCLANFQQIRMRIYVLFCTADVIIFIFPCY